jgi:uncharacterized protein YllA (UPF0747 family)
LKYVYPTILKNKPRFVESVGDDQITNNGSWMATAATEVTQIFVAEPERVVPVKTVNPNGIPPSITITLLKPAIPTQLGKRSIPLSTTIANEACHDKLRFLKETSSKGKLDAPAATFVVKHVPTPSS